MNIFKAIAGMIGWKRDMKRLEKSDAPVCSDAWWDELAAACKFIPAEGRKDFIDAFVTVMIDF